MPILTRKKKSFFDFFIILPPGLEELALIELKQVLKSKNVELDKFEMSKGGISVSLPLDVGFELNYFLKIPSSILLRITSFKCTDLPTLYKKIKNINWRDYIQKGSIKWTVTSRSSRIKIEKRIIQTCEDAYIDYTTAHSARQSGSTHDIEVLVRFFQDSCTVSINTSGEMLFKRGYRHHINAAPLRENLASGLIFFALQSISKKMKISTPFSTDAELHLYDPMCGSGTLVLEAATLHLPNRVRSYSFENFGICPDHLRTHHYKYWKKSLSTPHSIFKSLLGTDKDTKSIKACHDNYQDLKEKMNKKFDIQNIEFLQKDLFEKNKLKLSEPNTICLFNPPYGIRIKTEKNATNMAVNQIAHTYQPLLIGVVCPVDMLETIRVPHGYSKPFLLTTTGGGIRLSYWVTISTTKLSTLN